MTQRLFPTSTIDAGSWTHNGAQFYLQIDDPVASHDSDTTRVASSNAGDFLIVGISAGTDPGVDTGHVLRVVSRAVSTPVGGEIVRIYLRQGTSVIEFLSSLVTGSYVTYTQALNPSLVANITDYTDLNFMLEFDVNPNLNALRITAAELEVPDPVVGKGPIFQRHPSQRALLRR